MLVFIDESGDSGFNFKRGSSKYFAISLIIVSSKQEEIIRNEINEFKKANKIKKELHFSKFNKNYRTKFYDFIKDKDFEINHINVNKELIHSQELRNKPNKFYNFMLKQIITHATVKNAKFILDGKKNKILSKELKSYLRKGNNGKISSFNLKESHKDNMLQFADMIVGGISFYYKNDDDFYINKIKGKITNLWNFK